MEVRNSNRTIYNIDLSLAKDIGADYVILQNTSLNQKFNIAIDKTVPVGIYPTTKYYAIGNGGLNAMAGISGYDYSKHSPLDAALFNHIPFIMRILTNDIPATEQANYRFRTIEIHNNVQYACYYLKAIPNIDYRNMLYRISVNNGMPQLTPFNNNVTTLLNPIPVDKTNTVVNVNDAEYITKIAKLEFTFTVDELSELTNVFNILGTSNKVLTEIGICSGIDYTTTGNITEAYAVQIMYHVGITFDLEVEIATSSSLQKSIDIGGSEILVI